MSSDTVVILSARRTPVGAFQGVFVPVTGSHRSVLMRC
jgi:hypothetical protein